MLIKKRIRLEMAHRLMNHAGKCKNLHGHTYVVDVTIEGDINSNGMVLDFKDLKNILEKKIIEPYDHAVVLCERDPLYKILKKTPLENVHGIKDHPTAEVLAKLFAEAIKEDINKQEVSLMSVTVFETQDSSALFMG